MSNHTHDAPRHAPAKAGAYAHSNMDPSRSHSNVDPSRPRFNMDASPSQSGVGAGFSRSRAATAAFPISSEEDRFATRREFTKFLGLTSLAFFAGTFMAVGRKLWKRAIGNRAQEVHVAALDDVAV